jgi:hypothetical protein
VEIIIHQIICGEDDKGGYGLLKSTLSDSKLAKKIAFNTDIQEQTGAYQWDSAIRGFVVDDYFLIMKTFPDKSADVRPGRVFSHVLLIPKTDLINIQNLTPILELLPDKIDKEIIFEPILYKEESNFVTDTSSSCQGRFNKVIHGYVNAQDCSKTIIWIGVENFDTALSLFWKVLPVEEKETLNFGLNFNADAIPKGKLNFINIPENIESKFLNKGFCLVRKNDSHVLTEIFEQLIAGDPEANERLNKFKTIIETGDLSRDAINNIGKVLNTFECIDLISDLKKLNTLSHVVAEYSPQKEKGVVFKEKLLDKICDLVYVCDVSELHLIKTFKVNSFEGSERKLTQSINKWLENHLFSEKEAKTKNYSLLFEKLNGNSYSNWWTVNIKHQLDVFLSSIDVNRASIVMNWFNQDISILEIIESAIDRSSESENSFTIQLSKSFNKSHFQNLLSFALSRKWLRFHAKLMIFEYSFEQAISSQLLVDDNEEFFDGINEIIISISPISVINFAINNGDNRLIKICGKYCHTDSSLLANIEISNLYWQAIWLHSILFGNEIFDGITEPQEKVYLLLNILLNGKSYNIDLLGKISNTQYGNILYYPNRENIWKFIPNSIRTNFLNKTSTALLQKISLDTTTVIPDDKELSDFIISNGISDFLYFNRNNFKVTLPIFITFKQLPEHILKDYASNFFGNMDVVDATQLGKLVYQRNYKNVAHIIYQKSYSNDQFRISLKECHELLGIIDRGLAWANRLISNVEITENEWWEAFASLCIRLYPSGPKDSKIWERADGDESDLITYSTGKEAWNAILKKLRFGGCDEATPKKLIKRMLEDYKKNEELKTLKDLLEKT